jgi:hypothetical protein
MTPGFIKDMYTIRAKHDVRVNGGKIAERAFGVR